MIQVTGFPRPQWGRGFGGRWPKPPTRLPIVEQIGIGALEPAEVGLPELTEIAALVVASSDERGPLGCDDRGIAIGVEGWLGPELLGFDVQARCGGEPEGEHRRCFNRLGRDE